LNWPMNIVKNCMAIKKGENVQVWVDDDTLEIGKILVKEIQDAGATPLLVVFPDSIRPIHKYPDILFSTAKDTDAIITILSKLYDEEHGANLSAFPVFLESGVRWAFTFDSNMDIMEHEMTADFKEIDELSDKVAKILNEGKSVEVKTKIGTDITFSIEGRHGHKDGGLISNKGDFGNLPGGEACTAPIETSANGVVVYDGTIPNIGALKTPIRVTFKNGRIDTISGGVEADRLKKLISGVEGADIVAEFGISTNPVAKLRGNLITDEKVLGTAHIAIGDNKRIPIGGVNECELHIDGVFFEPTISIDGKVIMRDGKFCL